MSKAWVVTVNGEPHSRWSSPSRAGLAFANEAITRKMDRDSAKVEIKEEDDDEQGSASVPATGD